MILVSRLNGKEFFLNPSLIETLEKTPDTVIRLTTEKNLVVSETPEVIIERIIEYNRKIFWEKNKVD